MNIIRTLSLILLGGLTGFALSHAWTPGSDGHAHGHMTEGEGPALKPSVAQDWTCSMHPQVRLPKAGKCPICHMDLVPVGDGEVDDDGSADSLRLSPRARSLARVHSQATEHGQAQRSLRLYGQVELDESRRARIAAWVDGRIERVFVDETGVAVRRGQALLSLYSPQLFAGQRDLLNAARAAKAYGPDDTSPMAKAARSLQGATRERLRLWGMKEAQLDDLLRKGEAAEHVIIRASRTGVVLTRHGLPGAYVKTGQVLYDIVDLNRVWIWLEAYEEDLPWIKLGLPVTFETPALPGRRLEGRISLMEPVLDARGRILRLRVDMDNRDGALRPGMQVTARVQSKLPGRHLLIPDTALLSTGKRHIVYVEDEGPGGDTRYRLRHVIPGPFVDGKRIITAGLKAGERVATEGVFQVDAAMQIRGFPSLMNPEARPTEALPERERGKLRPALLAYLELQQALASDDARAAKRIAAALPRALRALPPGVEDRERKSLRQAARAMADTDAIELQRQAFQQMSDAWRKILHRHGAPDDLRLFEHHCPMAFDNRGAWWLDDKPEVANPYFGASMLRCADVSRPLGVGEESTEHEGSPT